MIKTIKLSLLCSAMVISLSQPAFAGGYDLNVDTDATYYDDGDPSTNSPPESTNSAADRSVVGGFTNVTIQAQSVAIGHVNTVDGANSVAIGRSNKVDGGTATALGTYNNTIGGNSNAIGSRNTAGFNQVDDPTTTEVETTIETKHATAVGNYSTALANDSLAIGSSATAGEVVNTDNAGVITTTVSGKNTIAIGTSSEALGDNAIALGAGANATHENSTALGVDAHATHDNTTAVGSNSYANAMGSTAIGYSNNFDMENIAILSSGLNSTAVGYNNRATGDNSSAFGYMSEANHLDSTAIGAKAVTSQANQIVLGTTDDTITAQGVYANEGDANTDKFVTVDSQGNLESIDSTALANRMATQITVSGGDDTGTAVDGQIQILDGSVSTTDLANDAVTEDKIANGAVTSDKILAGSIQSTHLAPNAITGDSIAEGSISYNKLGEDVTARFDALNESVSVANGGVAIAMAMANIPSLSAGKKVGFGLAVGAFEGEMGFAASGSAKLGDTGPIIQASLGQSGGTYSGAVGLSWAW